MSSSKLLCAVKSVDHIVLTCRDVEKTIAFYERLGLKHEIFRPTSSPETPRHFLKFGSQKLNLHQAGKEFEPKARSVQPGSADLCFMVVTPVEEIQRNLTNAGPDVLEGRAGRGANGRDGTDPKRVYQGSRRESGRVSSLVRNSVILGQMG